MSVSLRDLDPAFQGAGQKAGIEIWRIQNFSPVLVPKSSHGKFFTGDSYIILKTTALKNGALNHDIHYWLGKDTSQDEAGSAAIKTVELDAALGSRAVQYREVQGHESERFLSYFKPCIIPQEGGVASGFKHVEPEEHQTRLYECKGKHVVNVPFARSSLNHDDVFILDTKSKIFQFNGSNACIQERAKALEVVQYIKDTYHDGKCDIATIEFWGFFGGFAPLPKKTNADKPNCTNNDATSKLFCVEKGEAVPFEAEAWTRDLLETNKCYILDSGLDVFVWMGRGTSIEERKAASRTVDELLCSLNRSKSRIIRMVEGFEIVTFRTYFESWPQSSNVAVSTDGRGKVAALLKRQGLNVKGLKEEPPREEPQPYIDCSGDLQVWRINDQEKMLLQDQDQNKFYSGDCYIFQYSYSGGEREEYLVGTWFGKQSVKEDRVTASSLASKMVEALKFLPTQARIYEGHEPIQFFAILQSFIVFKGGLSNGYKNYIAEKELPDDTYTEDGLALFRIQGTGPENMQAIQVEPVASSLNSYYCYILHSGSSIFNWSGNLTTSEDQELVERQLDVIKPNMQSKFQKEGAECEQFWDLLGGKTEYSSEKISREAESDPHLFSCTLSKGDLKVTEVYNYNQDDLMTEDIFILDCYSAIYVWIGQKVDSKNKLNALNLGEEFLEHDFLFEKLSKEAPIYVITEGNEPAFFTRFFTWDPTKSSIHGNSFERKLAILKHGGTSMLNKPRRRPVIFSGRSAAPEKSQRSRSVTFSPERARVRGRSPAFNALASTFENPNSRNLSTPPPMVKKLYPRSSSPDSVNPPSKSAAIAALSAGFQQPGPARQFVIPRSIRGNEVPKPRFEGKMSRENSVDQLKSMPETIEEDVKEDEVEDDEGLPIYPYEHLITSSTDPIEDIDVTKRETYLSVEEFKEKFGMTKSAFNKLPKWKQNKMKISLQLF
ncbi:villin [Striga asiatica]|uniref:Villin n=1 Tax=Striga asiatica TaxID=4170 RepID=A0A5A7R5A7_STRAF|nr:villin [Striga asiatica]